MKRPFKTIQKWFKDIRNRPSDFDNMSESERKMMTRIIGIAGIVVFFPLVLIILIVALCSQSCSGPSKLQRVQTEQMQASIGLVQETEINTSHTDLRGQFVTDGLCHFLSNVLLTGRDVDEDHQQKVQCHQTPYNPVDDMTNFSHSTAIFCQFRIAIILLLFPFFLQIYDKKL